MSVWTSATVIAAAVTWTAVARLGQDAVANDQPTLSQSEVRQELARVLPSTTATPGKPTATRPTQSTPTSHPTSRPQPPRHYRTWNVTGGLVRASCRGAVIRLETWIPGDGWGVQKVDDSSPDKVVVEFVRGDSESKLEATCSGGVPVLKSDDD